MTAEGNEDVEVRTRFDGNWVAGYEVIDEHPPDAPGAPSRLRVRRRSDGRVLPATFTPDEVRRGR